MIVIPVLCLYCPSDQVSKRGKTATGKQRYRRQNPACPHRSVLLTRASKGRFPEVKQQGREMSRKGSGVRDPARV
jgi:transposase-like protein